MLKRLKIGPKLLLAPGVVLLLLVALSSAAYYAMVRQNDSLEAIVQQRAVHMRSAADLVATAQKAHAGIYQLLAWISGSFPRTRTDPLMASIHSQHAEVRRGFEQLERMTVSNGAERRYVEQAAAAWRVYVRAVLDVMELARNDQSISANAMLKAESAFVVVAQRLTELSRLEQELSGAASASAAEDFRLTSILMPVVVLLSIGLSLAITMAVRRSLLDEIKGIGAAAVDLASGDLTIKDRVYGNDEIAETSRALDDSIRNLNGTLRTILESARSIGSASREISLGSLSMTSRAVFRASSFEHTASSMQELAATVNLTADSVQEAHRLAASANSVAEEGSGVVDRLVGTMESVRGSARRVAEIIDQIDGIASETGTLALNAAVEAARAGEHGRDFAEVASEVRTLAQRASAAAREVRELVAQSVAQIDGGTAWAAQAGSSMARLASSVQQVGSIISQIGSVSAEQASGLSEVNQAFVQMDQMTQQNSAMVEEAAAAARSLQMQALTLSKAVAAFRLGEAMQDAAAPDEETAPDVMHNRRRNPGHPHLWLASSR
ncbi:MAG TPA: methyl-accepting chemotaxis protein [Telluria sp.]|nr:methyl-accepting chemotaxis protein [Telluria sp.]